MCGAELNLFEQGREGPNYYAKFSRDEAVVQSAGSQRMKHKGPTFSF